MTCSLPPERILLPSVSPIGTGKSKVRLFYVNLLVYSLATALLVISGLLSGGRRTKGPALPTPDDAINRFPLRATDLSYLWSTAVIS